MVAGTGRPREGADLTGAAPLADDELLEVVRRALAEVVLPELERLGSDEFVLAQVRSTMSIVGFVQRGHDELVGAESFELGQDHLGQGPADHLEQFGVGQRGGPGQVAPRRRPLPRYHPRPRSIRPTASSTRPGTAMLSQPMRGSSVRPLM